MASSAPRYGPTWRTNEARSASERVGARVRTTVEFISHDEHPEVPGPGARHDGRSERAGGIDGAPIDRQQHGVATENRKADGEGRKALGNS